jgi:hypothetical protein
MRAILCSAFECCCWLLLIALTMFLLTLFWNNREQIFSSTSDLATVTADMAQTLPQLIIPSLAAVPNNHSCVIAVNGTNYNLSNDLYAKVTQLRDLVTHGEKTGKVGGLARVKWFTLFKPHSLKLLGYALKLDIQGGLSYYWWVSQRIERCIVELTAWFLKAGTPLGGPAAPTRWTLENYVASKCALGDTNMPLTYINVSANATPTKDAVTIASPQNSTDTLNSSTAS